MLKVKVINFRKSKKEGESLKGFFDVLVGDPSEGEFTLVLRNCALKTKNAGGYWWQAPAQVRLDKKTKEPVIDPKTGFKIYDAHYDITLTKKGEKYAPSHEGVTFKENVLTQAVAAYTESGEESNGRGGAPAKAAAAPAGRPTDDDFFPDDDDLPF